MYNPVGQSIFFPALRFLLISVTAGCEPTNQLWYTDIQTLPRNPATGALDLSTFDKRKGEEAEALPITKIVSDFEASYDYVANKVKQTELLLRCNSHNVLFSIPAW